MHLEVVTRAPQGASRHAPLLFVHGAFCAAWVWEEHFLDWFAARGHACAALSLRGHGHSEGRNALTGTSLNDYADDVIAVMREMDEVPVLIGHSLGGMVVQRVMSRVAPAGAVLLASIPAHGLAAPMTRMQLDEPRLFKALGVEPDRRRLEELHELRHWLFSDALPADRAMGYLSRMGGESRRVMVDLLSPGLFWQFPCNPVPVLVLAARDDPFVSAPLLRATARRLKGDFQELDFVGHAMMLDAGWERVAQTIQDWLEAA